MEIFDFRARLYGDSEQRAARGFSQREVELTRNTSTSPTQRAARVFFPRGGAKRRPFSGVGGFAPGAAYGNFRQVAVWPSGKRTS